MVPYGPQIGWAKIAFVHAFRHLIKNSDYLTAIHETLSGGGDTGTGDRIHHRALKFTRHELLHRGRTDWCCCWWIWNPRAYGFLYIYMRDLLLFVSVVSRTDMRNAVLECDISRGAQKMRPTWLSTRLLPSLVEQMLSIAPASV